MKFESIYTDFKKLFPEETAYFSKAEKESVIEGDGDELPHISFGVFVMPLIYRLLEKRDDVRLKKAFGFFEDMANSTDEKIQELLQFTVLENLVTESKDIYKAAQKYIGPKTKALVNQISTYMDIDPMK